MNGEASLIEKGNLEISLRKLRSKRITSSHKDVIYWKDIVELAKSEFDIDLTKTKLVREDEQK